ncbi:MAG: hypothetical protein M1423_07385 [Acidobacteria bacterium]|nr:hypothetical protein [Acidobacteriota bacterium]
MRVEVLGVVLAVCFQAWGQGPAQSRSSLSVPAATQDIGAPTAGGKLHGTVKSGNIPLPGVTVTAQNTLTGKRYATTTAATSSVLSLRRLLESLGKRFSAQRAAIRS